MHKLNTSPWLDGLLGKWGSDMSRGRSRSHFCTSSCSGFSWGYLWSKFFLPPSLQHPVNIWVVNKKLFSASLTLFLSRTTCALCFLSFAYQIFSQNEWPNLLQTEKLNENNASAKFFANREVKWKMPVSVGSPSTLNYYLSWPVLTFVLSLWLINKTSHKFWSCIRSCVADNVNKS